MNVIEEAALTIKLLKESVDEYHMLYAQTLAENDNLSEQLKATKEKHDALLKRLDAQEELVNIAEELVGALENILSGRAIKALQHWREAVIEDESSSLREQLNEVAEWLDL